MSGTVAPMNPPPAPASTEPLKPVLFDDIDPVLLVRTQHSPDTTTIEDMKAKALLTGEETAAAGQELLANQQEPILTAETAAGAPAPTMLESPSPMPADTTTGGTGA